MLVQKSVLVVLGIMTSATLAMSGTAAGAEEQLAPLVDHELLSDGIVAASSADHELDDAVAVMESEPDSEVANAWVDPGTNELTVGVTSEATADAIEDELGEHGVDGAVVEVVAHSQTELDAIVEDVYSKPGMESISSAFHDYAANRVVLTSSVPVTEALRATAHDLFGDAVAIASEPVEIEPVSREADTSPFSAGAWTGFYGGPRWCTLAWSWVTPTGKAKMLTAGHCVPKGSDDLYATNAITPWEYYMGDRSGSTYESGVGTVGSDGDLALINLEGYGRSGAAKMWIGGPTSTSTTTVNSVDFWSTNGQAICYSGQHRGVQCGATIDSDGDGGYSVVDKDASFNDSGEALTHLAYASKGWGKCAMPGESGSPVYINTSGVGVAAHGVVSGAGGGGSDYYVAKLELSSCKLYFTEVGQAYDAWGGHVETIYG